MNVSAIQARLTSTDVGVLEQARAFTTELLESEMQRGSDAEGRAATTLAAIGVVAGFGVAAAPSATHDPGSQWILFVAYCVALAFLIRGAYFCVRTVSPTLYFLIAPNTVFEFQTMSKEECLRSEIAHKMWQLEQAVRPNSRKLFWLERGQRGLLAAVALLAALAVSTRLAANGSLTLPDWLQWIASASVVVLFIVFDVMIERTSKWREG